MTLLLVYCGMGLLAGVAAARLRTVPRLVIATAGMLAGVLVSSLPYVNWHDGTAPRTFTSGLITYIIPSAVLFGGPFLVGLLLFRLRSVKR